MVMPVRQRPVAAFDRRGGALHSLDPLGRPPWPIFQHLGEDPQGERVLGTCGPDGRQSLEHRGLAARAARLGGLVCPRDERQETRSGPLSRHGREAEWLHILSNAFPPTIHHGCQGRARRADLLPGRVPVRHLLALRHGFDGRHGRVHLAVTLRGRLGRRVSDPARRQRERARLQGVSIRARPLGPARPLGTLRVHLRVGLWPLGSHGGQPRGLARTASACVRAWCACCTCRAIGSEERCTRAGMRGQPSGILRHAKPCSASCTTALARALTTDSPVVPSACSRSSTPAFHVAELRSSATASCTMSPGGTSWHTSLRCSKKVSSTAPRLSRPSPAATPSCSQARAVASIVTATATSTPRQAAGAQPTCVARQRRAQNSLLVSTPTPRVRPQGERVATTSRRHQRRPSAVSHHQDSGWLGRRFMACWRRWTRLCATPVCWASWRMRCVPLSHRHVHIQRLLAHNPMSVLCSRGLLNSRQHSAPHST